MHDAVRAFVAIEIPPEVRQQARLLIDRLRTTPARVKWVEPHNLHWSLKFLGDVSLNDVPRICSTVAKAVADFAPFDFEARGVGAFPSPHHARTVWIGMGQGSAEMVGLHRAVEKALARIGFREERRRFRPHLTIGRVRGPEGAHELAEQLAREQAFETGLCTVFEVVVFASELGAKGRLTRLWGTPN